MEAWEEIRERTREMELKERELVVELRRTWGLPDAVVLLDPGHFASTMEFAEKLGGEPFESLKNALEHFKRVVANQGYTLKLYPDFVPHSFGFHYEKDGKLVYNGGVICHGLEGVETFSVEMASQEGIHWSIHT